MTNFAFLEAEWPDVYESAHRAEGAVHTDPRTACFYARRALELAVTWAYQSDVALKTPYSTNLSALLHDPSFKTTAGQTVFAKARIVMKLGNDAVHSERPVATTDALTAVRELFHVGYWLARTYARQKKPAPGVAFDASRLPSTPGPSKQSTDQLLKLEADLHARDAALASLQADKQDLDEALRALRAEVAKAKAASATVADTHDYSEADTRKYILDVLLREAGWPLDKPQDREYRVTGMPNEKGEGFVDYVLWGEDGLPLAVVEAKRTTKSSQLGKQQAKLYADCLEAQFGRRPVVFYTNGYEHWLWDDAQYPPRPVQGFYKRAELELLMLRRSTRKPLATAPIDSAIVERYYQHRAIRRIGEAFERDHERKALVVMATGAGKTRTVIALVQQLIASNWVKRVLFLADRVALVNQAVKEFGKHLPDVAPVNLVTQRGTEGRVYVSTYPTMMGLIDEVHNGQRRFGVGHFDLIVIDEAHRSVYQKYGAIFRYFDALLVGLTATPKDDIDVSTYRLFDLESGVPTDAYTLDEAVADKFLVPAKPISVPVAFLRGGIKYEDLSEAEKDEWDAIDWDEQAAQRGAVDAAALNEWLFNSDTVDKVLERLMTQGQHVAGGDRLGKTIIFAKSQKHAEFISERFDKNYPKYKGAFAQVVHCDLPYAQSLIGDFSVVDKSPHIAISVDMLDTGIDVPEVVNLVFFKLVRSKTKFWQMVGRGTRLRKDLFGPGQHKTHFTIFDYLQNLEFFSAGNAGPGGTLSPSLGTRLFRSRLEVIGHLDRSMNAGDAAVGADVDVTPFDGDVATLPQLRQALATRLHAEVASMNLDNFVVREKRRHVEKYAGTAAWKRLGPEDLAVLSHEVADLPNGMDPEDEDAKRFDLLMLQVQLAVLTDGVSFERLCERVQTIARLLEAKASIPMVNERMVLIQDLCDDEWWKDVTLPMLENARRRLRDLVKLIDKVARKIIYTDFEDVIGEGVPVDLPEFGKAADDFERFRQKARAYLREHGDHVAVHKLRMNKPLTASDLDELERMLATSGLAGPAHIQRAKDESDGLGLFVRSLVGLDREAAKGAFAGFLANRTFTANQIEFVNLIVNHLTDHGVMPPARLYESPFIDIATTGPDALFTSAQVDELFQILGRVREAAIAA